MRSQEGSESQPHRPSGHCSLTIWMMVPVGNTNGKDCR
ncbi:hypothetical protein LUZ100_gp03 [Pseudomonas phage LUZ100]|nr:hypothetical protein LUZ100_gp03 [Pseudomonas phage LUZ100]